MAIPRFADKVLTIYLRTKFEIPSFIRSKDLSGHTARCRALYRKLAPNTRERQWIERTQTIGKHGEVVEKPLQTHLLMHCEAQETPIFGDSLLFEDNNLM